MDSALATQPATYRQLLSRSLVLYRLSFEKIILFAFLLSVVAFTPRLVSDYIGQNILAALPPFSPHRLWLVVVDLVSLMFFIAIIWHMHCVLRKKHEPMLEDVATGARKAVAVFIAAFIQCAIIFLVSILMYGTLALLQYFQLLFNNSLPGIIVTAAIFSALVFLLFYVSTLFVFQLPLIALENKGIISAIENSIMLVFGNWWRVFSLQITPWLFYMVGLMLLKFVLFIDVNIYFTTKPNNDFTSTIINLAVFTLFVPWVAALLLTQLKDLELRKKLVPSKKRKRK